LTHGSWRFMKRMFLFEYKNEYTYEYEPMSGDRD
jgi:hypothetical protein